MVANRKLFSYKRKDAKEKRQSSPYNVLGERILLWSLQKRQIIKLRVWHV